MKRGLKAIISIVLCLSLVLPISTSAFAYSNSASNAALGLFDTEKILRNVIVATWKALNPILEDVVNGVAKAVPDCKDWVDYDKYKSENFFKGHDYFLDEPTKSSVWSLGYSQEILTPEDLSTKGYPMAGYSLGKIAYEKYDDIKVRTICLDDGSSRGKVTFSVVDCVGLANADVRGIRAGLSSFATANNIVSINVGASHTHSGLDTQGIWAKQPKATAVNILNSLLNKPPKSGVDSYLMEKIYKLTVKSVKDACNNMKQGELTLATKDISDYLNDKSYPDYFIKDLYRLRFDPYDGSKGTIIANFGAHPESVGLTTDSFAGDKMSADFVPYIEEVVNDGGFNFIFIQGAIGSLISTNRTLSGDMIPDQDRYDSAVRYGQEIGYILLGMDYKTEQECYDYVVNKEREAADMAVSLGYTPWYENWTVEGPPKAVEPILNIAFTDMVCPITNPLFVGIGKLGFTNDLLIKDSNNNVFTPTEIGYMEIGKNIKVLISPGETAPELVIGGKTMTSEGSVSGGEFIYAPLRDIVGEDLIVFDVMNDAAGYVIPDCDYGIGTLRYFDGKFSYNLDGIMSYGGNTASIFVGEFLALIEKMKSQSV
ncbi:MAG TPA: hypothetical protein VFD52_02120 [Clostridia bacterium]|nr:hypothetical protein [Clostridia bacterium]